MAKKDAVSKRLAEEIALAEFLKTVPFFPLEERPAPATEELPWLFQLGKPTHAGLGGSRASERPILDALATGALWYFT
jgi:hypothetical protein